MVSLLLFITGPGGQTASADGGKLRVIEQHGEHQWSVFTSPNPLRAGPIDLSVLVQDTHTGRVLTDVGISVELSQRDGSPSPLRAVATTEVATNKLLHAAQFDLPASGLWDVRVQCRVPRTGADTNLPVEIRFAMEAAPPLAGWFTSWLWFTWPLIAVLLFALHRYLVAQRVSIPKPQS